MCSNGYWLGTRNPVEFVAFTFSQITLGKGKNRPLLPTTRLVIDEQVLLSIAL